MVVIVAMVAADIVKVLGEVEMGAGAMTSRRPCGALTEMALRERRGGRRRCTLALGRANTEAIGGGADGTELRPGIPLVLKIYLRQVGLNAALSLQALKVLLARRGVDVALGPPAKGAVATSRGLGGRMERIKAEHCIGAKIWKSFPKVSFFNQNFIDFFFFNFEF